MERNHAKQHHVDTVLGSLSKQSKAFDEYATKVSQGIYRTNQSARHRNRNSLIKLQKRLTRRISAPKIGNEGKMSKITGLISLIDDDTNVEEDAQSPVISVRRKPVRGNLTNNSENDKNTEVIKGNSLPIHPFNVRQEMIDGENAIEAVINLEQGAQLNHNNMLPDTVEEQPVEPINLPVRRKPEVGSNSNDSKQEESNVLDECVQLYDPCTKEPIQDINALEKRVREIKQKKQDISNASRKFPKTIETRLQLLEFIINRDEPPNEGLLQYTINGNLYESYWDIVFALGLLGDQFKITPDFYMYKGKIETLIRMEGDGFMNHPLKYLSSKKINEGSKSGASDITFVYQSKTDKPDQDPCSSDLSVITTNSCKRESNHQNNSKKSIPLFYFCSVKYFDKDNTKGVDKFDIQNIYTAANHLQQEYNRKIILLVKDKTAVEDKLRNAIRKYISDEASIVYGMSDLFAALTILYDNTLFKQKRDKKERITIDDMQRILQLESTPKPLLTLRMHQYIATYRICDAIQSFYRKQHNNKFLVGIVPRGGKTFIAGGIIDQLQPRRVVVLLGAKSETLTQFKNDLFEQFQNFQEYECIDVVESTHLEIHSEKKYIFVMSVELYKQENSTRPLLQELKNGKMRADLFICDEAHLKQTTSRAMKQMRKGTVSIRPNDDRKMGDEEEEEEEDESTDDQEQHELKEIDSTILPDVPVVYMTGTYIKPIDVFKIPRENVVLWDYQDIQNAKNLRTNETYFKEIYGEYYERALHTCMRYGHTYESIEKQYQKFPELFLLSTQFTPDAKEAFLRQSSGGFPTITHLFEIRKEFHPEKTPPEQWHTGFRNPKGIMRLLHYLAPPSDHMNSEPISSVLKTIDKIAQQIGDRLGFFTSDFITHSQLWFLPHMNGNPLYHRMCALAGSIFQLPWFRKHFHVVAVSSSIKWNIRGSKNNSIAIQASDGTQGIFTWDRSTGDTSLKERLLDQEENARKQGKGLIILAQNMLHLGISLPCVDIVVLLDSGEKMDERIQKMYRALTESTNKKGGYIVDMNYFRTVSAIMKYNIVAEESRKGKKVYRHQLQQIFNQVLDIYSIDIDKPIFGTREERQQGTSEIQKQTIPELERQLDTGKKGDGMEIDDAGYVLNSTIDSVMKDIYKGTYDDLLGMLKEEERKRAVRKPNNNVKPASYNSNSNSNSDSNSNSNSNSNSPVDVPPFIDEKRTEEQKRAAFFDIFKTTLKLAAFGTNAMNIQSLEEQLAGDEELRYMVYDALVKRDIIKKDNEPYDEERKSFIIDQIIRPGLNKIIKEGRNEPYMAMKGSVNDEEQYPEHVEKVLDYITQHLAPKDTERHKYGEVFTPMSLVHEMLDTLPEKVWSDPSLTWLDPANGMGNYPIAVFLRLFYGFRTKDGKYAGITSDGEGKYHPGLTKAIENETKRRKHIVKDMLFMIELNSKNNAIAKKLFQKLAPGIEPNIIQHHRTQGFLSESDMKFPNRTMKEFDIIMGNPPYNKGSVRVAMVTSKTRNARKELGIEDDASESGFWFKFVDKAITQNVLKPNGYLLFIHPITWFKPDRMRAHDLMLSKQIHKIRIYFKAQAKQLFGGKGEISVAYYLLENKNQYAKTQIINMRGKEEVITKLTPTSILILEGNTIYNKVVLKSTLFGDGGDLQHKTIKSCDDSGEHKLITILEDSGQIKYVSSSTPHQDQDTPKIIIGGVPKPIVLFDKKGEYGLYKQGQRHYFIGENLDQINDYFKTKLSTYLLRHIKFEQGFIKPSYYPDVRTLGIKTINDKTLADYFGFTAEERKEIDQMPDPVHPTERNIVKITCSNMKKEKARESLGGSLFAKTRKRKN